MHDEESPWASQNSNVSPIGAIFHNSEKPLESNQCLVKPESCYDAPREKKATDNFLEKGL
jgi:hypothetical protein